MNFTLLCIFIAVVIVPETIYSRNKLFPTRSNDNGEVMKYSPTALLTYAAVKELIKLL